MNILNILNLSFLWLVYISSKAIATSPTCSYDPSLGINPLGMRAYITITQKNKDTVFTYEQFPRIISKKVTLAQQRTLTFYDMNITQARQVLVQNPQYYSELVGYNDPEGFAMVNAVLACRGSN